MPLNNSLSDVPLGFGVMRLPVNTDGTFSAEVHKLLQTAYEQGVRYFDTAYLYLGGHSEKLICDAIVKKYPRNSFYIADKLPVWDCHSPDDMEWIFNTQLERLGVDYIDFYLLHGLNRVTWSDVHPKGVLEFLKRKKNEGKIRKVGFSMHDDTQTLKEILDSYNWEFTMLQINYYDWTAQNVKNSYDLLEQRGIPCMVMEPIGGGRLAKLPPKAEKLLKSARPNDSVASWAMRFVAGLPNVIMTLSGMNSLEQLSDNIACFDVAKQLSEQELKLLDEVVKIFNSCNTIPCTACCYCVDYCPKNIDIPQIFQRYNDYKQFSDTVRRFDIDYFMFIPESRRADKCIKCNICSSHCPQKIDISKELETIHLIAFSLAFGVDIEKLRKLSVDNKIILFGAGVIGLNTLSVLKKYNIKVSFFCDNSEKKWGTVVDGIEIISPARLKEIFEKESFYILVTSQYATQINRQLKEMGLH